MTSSIFIADDGRVSMIMIHTYRNGHQCIGQHGAAGQPRATGRKENSPSDRRSPAPGVLPIHGFGGPGQH